MATYGPVNLPAFFGGDADFRTWAQGIHNALAALPDLTQTADTGQINFATVTRPAVNVAAGYEIWRFNDALQATVPIFIKLEYGVGGAIGRPSLWLTIGTGSTGAGVLTGLSSRLQVASASSKSAGVLAPLVASSDPGRLDLALNQVAGPALYGIALHLERARDALGVATADGAVLASSGASSQMLAYNPTNGMLAPNTALLLSPTGNITCPGWAAVGNDRALVLPVWYAGKPCYGFGIAGLDVGVSALASFTAWVLGANRTYLSLGQGAIGFADYTAMRWE